MTKAPLKIGIVAGEASGDILAAGLVQRILEKHPDAIIEGIGGPNMLALGVKSLFDMEELSVMGLVEVLSRIRRLIFIRKTVLQHFIDNPPDVFIGVDAPDFNLTLEKNLKARGIKTVHYVSPTVWAWRENRIYGIIEATNLVLSIFPFEKKVYDKHNHPCQFVGHTMADDIPLNPDKLVARQTLELGDKDKVLALLPGSRRSEVAMLLEIFMKSAALINEKLPNFKVVIPASNQVRKEQIEAYVGEFAPGFEVKVTLGQSREAMIASDTVLLASGTASLEAMLCKRPMVVAYRLKWLTHQMMRFLYKAKYFALPNLLADELIVPELLQEDVNPQTISEHLLPLLSGEKQQNLDCFDTLHKSLRKNADIQSADAVLALLNDAKA